MARPTPAGEFRYPVVIQQNTPTKDTAGQSIPVWSQFAKVWARVNGVTGGENLRGVQIQPEVTDAVTIRYLAGVTPKMQILHDGRTLNIASVIDTDGQKRELLLQCKELVAT